MRIYIFFLNSRTFSTDTMDGLTTVVYTDNSTIGNGLFVFENYPQRIIIACILGLVFMVGVTGNTLVILAVVLSRKLRSITNYFVVNLAFADLLICLAVPFQMVAMLSRNGWPMPEWICAVASAISFVCLGASVDTLALIAYNRWYLLTQPKINFQRLYTKRNVLLMVLCAWLYPFILVLVPHFAGLGRLGYSSNYKSCTQDTTLPSSDYYSLLAGACAIIPVFIAIAVIYVKIYRFVSKQNKKMAAMSQPKVEKTVYRRTADAAAVMIEMGSSSSTGQHTASSALSDTSESNILLHQQTTSADAQGTLGADNKNVTLQSPAVNMPSITSEMASRDLIGDGNAVQNTTIRGSMIPDKMDSSKLGGEIVTPEGGKSHKKSAPPQLNRHHVTVTKKLAIIVLAFLICLLPFGISVVVPPSDPGVPWTGLMVTFNSCVNPIIYARTMPVFREIMGCIVKCSFRSIPDPISCIRRRY